MGRCGHRRATRQLAGTDARWRRHRERTLSSREWALVRVRVRVRGALSSREWALVRVRVRVRVSPNPNPNPNLTLTSAAAAPMARMRSSSKGDVARHVMITEPSAAKMEICSE